MEDFENLRRLVFVLLCVSGFVGTTFYLLNRLKKSIDKKYPTPKFKVNHFVTDSEVTFTRLNIKKIILKPKITRLK